MAVSCRFITFVSYAKMHGLSLKIHEHPFLILWIIWGYPPVTKPAHFSILAGTLLHHHVAADVLGVLLRYFFFFAPRWPGEDPPWRCDRLGSFSFCLSWITHWLRTLPWLTSELKNILRHIEAFKIVWLCLVHILPLAIHGGDVFEIFYTICDGSSHSFRSVSRLSPRKRTPG